MPLLKEIAAGADDHAVHAHDQHDAVPGVQTMLLGRHGPPGSEKPGRRSHLVVLVSLLASSVALGLGAVHSTRPTSITTLALAIALVAPAIIAAAIALGRPRRTLVDVRIARGWRRIGVASAAAAPALALATAAGNAASLPVSLGAIAIVLHCLFVLLALTALACWVPRLSLTTTFTTIVDLCILGLASLIFVAQASSAARDVPASLGPVDDGTVGWLVPALDLLLLVVAIPVLNQIGRHGLPGPEVVATLGIVTVLGASLHADVRAVLGTISRTPSTGVAGDDVLRAVTACIGFSMVCLGAFARVLGTRRGRGGRTIERSTTWDLAWTLAPFIALAATIVAWRELWDAGTITRTAYGLLVAMLVARCALVAVLNLHRARAADVDPLTGAYTHSYLQVCLPTMAAAALREGKPLSLLVIDVDDFAVLNESSSHAEGDRVLREMSFLMSSSLDHRMLLFRPGGDEFAIVMPETSSSEALEIARVIEDAVSRIHVNGAGSPSLTMGLAALPQHASSADELQALANGARYWGKLNGKHSVTVYDPELVTVMSDDDHAQVIERSAQLKAVLSLARALDARDAGTARHSLNVAQNAVAIANELGWSSEQQELLRIAGLLHDIGKIGVRDSTLRKTSPLDSDERAEMQRHPELSAQLIAGTVPEDVIPWVIGHHERFDGRGYPHALAGDDIPLGARILAVADTFDAMSSSRSYRTGMPIRQVLDEIVGCAGDQFDPGVVKALLTAIARGNLRLDGQVATQTDTTAPLGDDVITGAATMLLGPEFSIIDDQDDDDLTARIAA